MCDLAACNGTAYLYAFMNRVGGDFRGEIGFCSKFLRCRFITFQNEEIKDQIVQIAGPSVMNLDKLRYKGGRIIE